MEDRIEKIENGKMRTHRSLVFLLTVKESVVRKPQMLKWLSEVYDSEKSNHQCLLT